MRRIAFLSEKGGVGKSTLCVNIGAALASVFGRRVLLIDLDGMSCASQTLAPDVDAFEHSIGAALIGLSSLADLVRPTALDNLFIVPGSPLVKNVEMWDLSDTPAAAGQVDPDFRLKDSAFADQANSLGDAFDYVLVDPPGGLRFMEQSALMMCDGVIIPTGLSVYDYYAITPTIELVLDARRRRGDGKPEFLGFLPNGATARGVPADVRSFLEGHSAPVFSPVRASQLLKTSPGWRQVARRVLVTSRPDSQVALSIIQVAREIEHGIEKARQMAAQAGAEIEGAAAV